MNVTDTLRSSRIAAGLSQRRLGEILGVTQAYVCDIEHGRRSLGEKYLEMLPEPIRYAVAGAMIREHLDAISRIGHRPPERAEDAA